MHGLGYKYCFLKYNECFLPNFICEFFETLQPKYELPKFPVTQISSPKLEFFCDIIFFNLASPNKLAVKLI